jgi:hypothetical protein
MPPGGAGSRTVEIGGTAPCRPNTPAGEGARKTASLISGEEKAGRTARLRGEAKTPGDEGCFHLNLAKSRDAGATLQPFFKRPCRV